MLYRIDKLFLILVLLVYITGIEKLYTEAKTYVTKEQVFSHNVVAVTLPLLLSIKNKDQLAAIIGHEISHIHLKHTISGKHDMTDEYDADLMAVYYLRKAGYSVCGAKEFWETRGKDFLSLKPGSHPNAQTRAFYMTFPECRDYISKVEDVTVADAKEIFENMNKHVAGVNRYKTYFRIIYLTIQNNAFAWTETKDKR